MTIAAIQLQWRPDQTTLTTLDARRNIIFAASTDNIQARAISACEGFGATIAIRPDTSGKIELTVVPMQQTRTLNSLLALLATLEVTVLHSQSEPCWGKISGASCSIGNNTAHTHGRRSCGNHNCLVCSRSASCAFAETNDGLAKEHRRQMLPGVIRR